MRLDIAVSLLINSVGAFVISGFIVLVVMTLGRIRGGRLRVALLSLPFAKLVFDLLCGVSDQALLLAGPIEPQSRAVLVGVGLAPPAALRLQVVMRASAEGREYVLSMGDYIVDACRKLDPVCVPVLAAALGLPAVALLVRRLHAYAAFESTRRRLRARSSRTTKARCGLRTVEIYEAPSPLRTAFSGGFLRLFGEVRAV